MEQLKFWRWISVISHAIFQGTSSKICASSLLSSTTPWVVKPIITPLATMTKPKNMSMRIVFWIRPLETPKRTLKIIGGCFQNEYYLSNIYKLLGVLNFCSIWGVWVCIFNVATLMFQFIVPTIVAFTGQCHRWIDKCFTHKAFSWKPESSDLMASSSSSWSISSAESKQQNRVSSCTRFQGHTEILQESFLRMPHFTHNLTSARPQGAKNQNMNIEIIKLVRYSSTRTYSNNQTYVTYMQTIHTYIHPVSSTAFINHEQEVSERQILIGVYPLHMTSCNPVTSTCSGDIALSTASRRCCSLKYWKAWKGCEMPQNLEMNVKKAK